MNLSEGMHKIPAQNFLEEVLEETFLLLSLSGGNRMIPKGDRATDLSGDLETFR